MRNSLRCLHPPQLSQCPPLWPLERERERARERERTEGLRNSEENKRRLKVREIVGVKGEDNKEGKVINNYTYIGNGEMDRKRNESKHVKRVCTGKQR